MNPSDSREARMLALLLDLEAAEQPAPEQLARYARDPEAMDRAERLALEARIAESPQLADQLRVLRNFDAARSGAARSVEVERPRQQRPRTERRAWWSLNWLWAPSLALASLGALVIYPLLQQAGDETGPLVQQQPAPSAGKEPIQLAAKPADSQREPSAQAPESAPAAAAETTTLARTDSAQADSNTSSESQPGEAASQPAPVADARPKRDATPPPSRLARAETPAPTASESAPPSGATETPAAPPPARTETRVATAEPTPAEATTDGAGQGLVLAMVEPVYDSNFAATDFGGTVVRGATATPQLRTLAPPHLARTSQARPTLYWHLAEALPAQAEIELLLEREDNGELLVETTLRGDGAGLQRIDLGDYLQAVPLDTALAWTLILFDPANPLADAVSSARLLRIAPEPAVQQRIAAADPGAEPAAYARAGLWYDALAAALRLRRLHPENTSVARGLEALLSQAGLDGIEVEP